MDFLNNLKESLSKNESLSKITETISDFIEELSGALKNNTNNDTDIVTQIASSSKLTLASENSIIKARNEVLSEYASKTEEQGALYFVYKKSEGEDNYIVWEYNSDKRTQIEVEKKELPEGANVNTIMRMQDGNFVIDQEATKEIINEIEEKANEIIEKQNQEIEDYKEEGHTYLVTEDIDGRVFLWDSTEEAKYEIEDVYFPEELKDKAKEGNSFLYQNGTYNYISE